jgi:hypothetical protein
MSSHRKIPKSTQEGLRYYFYYNPEREHYEKIAFIRGVEYKLSIKGDLWTPSTSKAVSRWIRSMNENRVTPMLFRWGSIQRFHPQAQSLPSLIPPIHSREHSHDISPSVSHPYPNSHPPMEGGSILGMSGELSMTIPMEGDGGDAREDDGDKDGGDAQEDGSDLVITSFSCVGCGRAYSTRSGLWKHEQVCNSLLVTHRSSATKHNPRELGNIAGIQEASRGGIQIQNNNQNIQNINITLRDFGKENPDWLTENILYSILGNVSNAIPMMMQKKHFNDAFPENMNLRLNTKNDMNQRLQVWEGGKWRIRDSKETFYKVVIEIYDILSDALSDRDEDEVEEDTSIHPEIRKARRSQRFLDKVKKIKPLWEDFREKIESQAEGDDNEVLKDLWEDLKTFLLDRKLCLEQEK